MTKNLQRFKAHLVGAFRARAKRPLDRFVAERSVRIAPVRELAFPFQQFEVDFSNPLYGISHRETAGIYSLEDLFIHRDSGLALLAPDETFWPIGVAESGLEDYQLLALQYGKKYRPLVGFNRQQAADFVLNRPAFLFNVFKRKTNYYHFIVDNALRLVTFLEQYDAPVTVLASPGLSGYMREFFELLGYVYGCSLTDIPTSASHLRVRSPLLFMDDVVRRFDNSGFNFDWVRARLANEPAANRENLSLDHLKPIRQGYLVPKFWRLDKAGRHRIRSWWLEKAGRNRIRNNYLPILPSRTAVDCFTRFIERLEEAGHLKAQSSKGVFISRYKDSTRGRNVANEEALLAAVPEVIPTDFGILPLVEQIAIARGTKVLVGMHGAGLTNALFMREGAGVIEIVPAGQSLPASNLFENLCALRRLKYRRIFASPLDAARQAKVDVGEVTAAIEEVVR